MAFSNASCMNNYIYTNKNKLDVYIYMNGKFLFIVFAKQNISHVIKTFELCYFSPAHIKLLIYKNFIMIK
jgi:hypothetical protein